MQTPMDKMESVEIELPSSLADCVREQRDAGALRLVIEGGRA